MSRSISATPRVAVVIPCYNEEAVIGSVVEDFRKNLPDAQIYVIDNNSIDDTAGAARRADAYVIHEAQKGKGNAVRRAFAEIDADVYVMTDGDGTYDATRAPEMVDALVHEHLDMVVGTRHTDSEDAYRKGHRFGNKMLNRVLRFLFEEKFEDILSGYRVFSRRFVKTFPALSAGFEIETEMSIHAIHMGCPTKEIATQYFDRGEGTASKLNTYRDGLRILFTMLMMFRHLRPLAMFLAVSCVLLVLTLVLGLPVVFHFLETGMVPRLPTAVAAAGLMVMSVVTFVTGIILDSITYSLKTNKRLAYLQQRSGVGGYTPQKDNGEAS